MAAEDVTELKKLALDHTADVHDYVTTFAQFLSQEAADRIAASRSATRLSTERLRDEARAAGAMRLAQIIRDIRQDFQHQPVASGLLALSTALRRAIAEADPTKPAEAAVAIYAIRLIHVIDDWRVYVASLGASHKPLAVDFPPDPDEI